MMQWLLSACFAALAAGQSVRGAVEQQAEAIAEIPMHQVPTNKHTGMAIASIVAAALAPFVGLFLMYLAKVKARDSWWGAFRLIFGIVFVLWCYEAGILQWLLSACLAALAARPSAHEASVQHQHATGIDAVEQHQEATGVAAPWSPMQEVPTNTHTGMAIASMVAAVLAPFVGLFLMYIAKVKAQNSWWGACRLISGIVLVLWCYEAHAFWTAN